MSERTYTMAEWEAEQKALRAEATRKGVFRVRRAGGGFIRPTGGEPYTFQTKDAARDAIRLMEDGPVIAGAWEIVEVST